MKWLDLVLPRDHRFGPLLCTQADIAARACALLADPDATPARMARIEAEGDAARRELADTLARVYATPFDRDDIFELSSALDDVTDAAQDALLTQAVFGGGQFAHAQEMCFSLQEGGQSLRIAVGRLPGSAAREPARRAKRMENTVSNAYRYGLDLALRTRPPEEAMRLRETLAALRGVGRSLGHAADLVVDVTVKEK